MVKGTKSQHKATANFMAEKTQDCSADPSAASLSTVVDFVNLDTSGAYVQYAGTVTATSATSQLEFLGRQDLDFYSLDDVSLTGGAPSSVPEPEAWLLSAAGLLTSR
jgi:hypothetical protein